MYIRRGSLIINSEKEEVESFNSVVFVPTSRSDRDDGAEKESSFVLQAGDSGFDGLVLIGRPLNERCAELVINYSAPFNMNLLLFTNLFLEF